MNCSIHNEIMQEQNGRYGVYYSHIVEGQGYCNGKKITPFKTTPQPLAEMSTPASNAGNSQQPNWDQIKDKEQSAMYKMAALKAASGIIAAEIARPDFELPNDLFAHTENFTNKLLKWLKSTENSTT